MEFFSNLLASLPGAVAQGLIWGLMAIGVYITFKVLDLADLTVDGTMATGGAVCLVLMTHGVESLGRAAVRVPRRYAGRVSSPASCIPLWVFRPFSPVS